MKNSKFLSLNTNDFLKGLLVAVLTAIITAVMQALSTTPVVFDLKQIGIVAITAMAGYILKQLGTNTDGEFAKKDSDNDIIGNRPNDR